MATIKISEKDLKNELTKIQKLIKSDFEKNDWTYLIVDCTAWLKFCSSETIAFENSDDYIKEINSEVVNNIYKIMDVTSRHKTKYYKDVDCNEIIKTSIHRIDKCINSLCKNTRTEEKSAKTK